MKYNFFIIALILLSQFSIVNSHINDPHEQYFPETRASWYWTSSENKSRDDVAWYVLFRNGLALNDLKERPKHIRLVREVMTN